MTGSGQVAPDATLRGASSVRLRPTSGTWRRHGRWCSAFLLLPLWLGWVFGSLGHLQAADTASAHAQARTLATAILAGLDADAFAPAGLIVSITGHRCDCARADDAARWDRAVQAASGRRITVEMPGAVFSTLAFDASGALRFAGSPAAAGCTGDPARLLGAVMPPSAASATPFVSACVC